MGIIRRKGEKRTEAVFEAMTVNFTHVNLRQQTKSPGISENTKLDNVLKNKPKNKKQKNHLGISYTNCRKSKVQKKILKETRGKKTHVQKQR